MPASKIWKTSLQEMDANLQKMDAGPQEMVLADAGWGTMQ